MGRKRVKRAPKKKSGGGLLIGMRSGVQKLAKGVTGGGDDAAKPASAKWTNWFWNIVTVAVAIVAGFMMLRNCGVIPK